jgi:hypothetical protein
MVTGFLGPLFLLFVTSLILGGFVNNNSASEGPYSALAASIILPTVSLAWSFFAHWFLAFREWKFLDRLKNYPTLILTWCAVSGGALITAGVVYTQLRGQPSSSLLYLGAEGAAFLVAFGLLWRRGSKKADTVTGMSPS